MDSNHDIGKLFSNKLKNYQVPASDADWHKINSKLNRTNFVKFSLVTFNIYYLTAILIFAGSATYTGVKNFSLSNKVQKLEKSIEVYQNTGVMPNLTEETIDTLQIQESEEPEHIQSSTIPVIITKKVVEPIDNKVQNKGALVTDTVMPIKSDSLKVNVKVPAKDSMIMEKKVKKVKKTVYVKPTDVLKRDTVILSKPKK